MSLSGRRWSWRRVRDHTSGSALTYHVKKELQTIVHCSHWDLGPQCTAQYSKEHHSYTRPILLSYSILIQTKRELITVPVHVPIRPRAYSTTTTTMRYDPPRTVQLYLRPVQNPYCVYTIQHCTVAYTGRPGCWELQLGGSVSERQIE